VTIAPPVETPALGCLHPEYKGGHGYFTSPAEYMKWCVMGMEGYLTAEYHVMMSREPIRLVQ
jgi:hypothetical protein